LKKLQAIILLITVICISSVSAETLSVEKQIELITNYMVYTNQADKIPSGFATSELINQLQEPVKCAMSPVMDFSINRHRLDKNLMQSMGLSTFDRSDLPNTYLSSESNFKIHYTVTGDDAVYEADKDSDGDGVPDYIENVANIFEHVRHHIIDTLGYPIPPNDSIVDGDPTYDVFIQDIDANAYGYTYSDDPNIALTGTKSISSYITLDNDYKNISSYADRPLDAVKVTAAHEFFHAIHFGLDFKEFETYDIVDMNRRYWMEMSAVWMEEEIYDEVNDYYVYLSAFYNDPTRSLQQFLNYSDLHPYGSCIFPMFLSQKFGKDMIFDIWSECGDTLGPNFLRALDHQLDPLYFDDPIEMGMNTAIHEIFNEFTLWNLFTGVRAESRPEGIGYSEAEFYPEIPSYAFLTFNSYPKILMLDSNFHNPDHLGATYTKFEQTDAFKSDSYWLVASDSLAVVDTSYWKCTVISCIMDAGECVDSTCVDSINIYDVAEDYDWVNIDTTWCDTCEVTDLSGTNFLYVDALGDLHDSLISNYDFQLSDTTFTIYVALDKDFPHPWGINIVYQDKDDNSFTYEDSLVQGIEGRFDISHPEQYKSITFIVSPASEFRGDYQFTSNLRRGKPKRVGWLIQEDLVDSLLTSSIDYTAVNVEADILYAFPNPAVISNMSDSKISIRYQVPTDAASNYLYSFPEISMDIFTVNGEYIRHIDTVISIGGNDDIYSQDDRTVLWEASWDLKNENGTDVSSGIYLIMAKMHDSDSNGSLLVEKMTKVAIIR